MGGRGSKDKSAFLVKSIADHAKDINCMALSEDQSVLVTGSEDCTAKMYDLKDKDYECLGTFEGHTSYITCITIADTFTFTGSNDTTIRKWDMTTCLCVNVYYGHTARISRVICNHEFLFSTSHDKTARAWFFSDDELSDSPEDFTEQEYSELLCIRTFKGHNKSVYPIIYISADDEYYTPGSLTDQALNPNDLIITGSGDFTAKIWSFDLAKCLHTLKGHRAAVTCMTTDAQGIVLYTGSADKSIRSWNIQRGECLRVMEEHDAPVMNLLIVNRLMYSCSQDCTARCWVREFGDCTNVYRDATDSLVVIHVKNGLLFTAGGDSVIRVYDIKSGALKETFEGHSASVQCLAIAGNRMYTAGYDNTLKIWNIESLRMEKNSMLDDEDLEGLPLHNHQPLLNNRINKYDDVDVNSAPAMK
ncbi:WD repeat-containing protein 86 [Hyalella azteca]|uniref:WD repeat-containing protein 86 n=1 Tax=Hyalella azteca TaxID=294128 RepID=A0A8B7NPL6_HYAAZ|nr:WD repeat-containing protein 86 [Hyalella azteca]